METKVKCKALRMIACALLSIPSLTWGQSADLQMTATATRTFGLTVAAELVVTTSVRNAGPGASSSTNVLVSAPPTGDEPFALGIVGAETPGCLVDFLDFDPVRFNHY